MHAVSGRRSRVEQTVVRKVADRGPSFMTFHALLVLRLCLGNVDMHIRADALRVFRELAHGLLCRSVLSVKAHVNDYPPVSRAVVSFIKTLHLCCALHIAEIRIVEIRDGPGYVVHASGIEDRSCHVFAEIVHVRRGHDPESQRFRHREKRGQFRFEREYAVIEPLLKRHVFAVAAHKRHWRVGVGVYKTGHEQFPPAVVFLSRPGERPAA